MEINKTLNGDELIVAVSGEINTATYQELEDAVKGCLFNVKSLIFDFKDLVYISSAGLRTLLVCKKAMPSQGRIVIRNANENVMEIFEITGFSNLLDFE